MNQDKQKNGASAMSRKGAVVFVDALPKKEEQGGGLS